MKKTKKILPAVGMLMVLLGISAFLYFNHGNQETENYVLPKIIYCGYEEDVNPNDLSHISLVEESMCTLFKGEMFLSEKEAKEKYGIKTDLSQKETLSKPIGTTQYSGFTGDKIKIGEKEIKILSVDASSAQFGVENTSKTILINQSDNIDGLKIKVKSICGITYRTDFEVTQYPCCPPDKENIFGCLIETANAAEEDERDNMTKKADEETKEDLKASGRSGYKGVILPKNVAKEYPSMDFVILPFITTPNELCCGCMQEYENLSWMGEYTESKVISELARIITELNEKKSEYEENPYTLVQRDESAMRFALREINYIKQNEDYFDPEKRVPKGEWINPDYVIEGGMEFNCCENSKLVKTTFSVKFINAKTEKKFEEASYTPTECFDLVNEAGRLMAVSDEFAKKTGETIKNRFVKQ